MLFYRLFKFNTSNSLRRKYWLPHKKPDTTEFFYGALYEYWNEYVLSGSTNQNIRSMRSDLCKTKKHHLRRVMSSIHYFHWLLWSITWLSSNSPALSRSTRTWRRWRCPRPLPRSLRAAHALHPAGVKLSLVRSLVLNSLNLICFFPNCHLLYRTKDTKFTMQHSHRFWCMRLWVSWTLTTAPSPTQIGLIRTLTSAHRQFLKARVLATKEDQ